MIVLSVVLASAASVMQTIFVSHEQRQDSLPYGNSMGTGNEFRDAENQKRGFHLDDSPDYGYKVEYDAENDEYVATKKIGDENLSPSFSLPSKDYYQISGKQRSRDYWQTRARETRRGGQSSYEPSLDLLDKDGALANLIDIKPQGAAELNFGLKFTNNHNPRLSKKQQRQLQFDFDNKIQMSVTGSIGDRVSMTIKYDTESQFEFEQEVKLQYKGDEDEIIKNIEVGNVSFPLSSSLISGSSSLFGVKTDLQFGKLYLSGVFSRQQGETSSISVQGGAQTEEFEIQCDEYDNNKHFFLSHFFREHYEESLKNLPEINSGIEIRKVEIWVTQTSSGKEDARNILAVTDLGDTYTNSIGGKTAELPENGKLYKTLKNLSGIRSINTVSTALNGIMEQGPDYEKIEQAVLLKSSEYDVNTKLGYVSLRSAVSSSKVLAVAYEYEYKGKVYQVGEFSSDGIEHPDVLIVKLLKGTQSNPAYNNWDLMMKNVYSIGAYQVSQDDFVLDVLYQDDRTGSPIPYLSEGSLKGKSLLSVLNLDTLSSDLQPYSDGLFDFVEGVTIKSSRGLVYFPVLEPFGSYLAEQINDSELARKYVYQELYDSTQSSARQLAEKNKFKLKGSYKSSVSSEISLNTTQVKSVKVMCGGLTLQEGADYTVDYSSGTVSIINTGILESGSTINITYENDPLFSTTTKTYMGTRAEYRYNDNISFGSTLIHLSEVPAVQKVGFDDYPISNTIWGVDAKYSTESMFLTKMVDKIPLINTKELSYVEASAEFAQLLPGRSRHISNAVSIDDFESSEGKIYLKEPTSWKIASTPQGQKSLFPEASLINDLAFNYNKALISWYNINTSFYERSSPVSKSVQAEQFSRTVYQSNLFPNRDLSTYEDVPMTLLNIAFYPSERGQNNYDTKGRAGISAGLDANGRLNNPSSRWGGIMQSLTTTDFEETNVEYIEFWMMDPFITDEEGLHQGGDFYINIGRISEDVLRDGRKSAENGIVVDKSRYDETTWGHVPNYSVVETGFSSDIDREIQDVGLDGLSDYSEQRFFAQYLQEVKEIITPVAYEVFAADPSHDNFSSYLDNRGEEHDIVWRYRYYNGTDGNSPEGVNQGLSSYKPDIEDLNQDNTLQETEAYYQYHISLRPEDMVVGKNFIEDKTVEVVNNDNYQTQATWYQFKIPIKSEDKQTIGNISDFRDITSMRLFLQGFNDSIVLRIAELALVYSNWRVYEEPLFESGEYDLFSDSKVDISNVNIEENSSRTPVNYVLPPGVDRVIDPTSTTLEELNEASISMKVVDLEDGNSKAIYKQVNKDFRQFGSLEMFIHAEALIDEENSLEDGDLCAFIRLGSDYVDNYYEYEVPLSLTPHIVEDGGRYTNSTADRLIVWPESNKISLPLEVLTDIKLERNKMISDGVIPDLETYHIYTISHGSNRVSIKGNPNTGNVRTIMIGVRNRKKKSSNPSDDGLKKSGIVWFDELRLTDMNDKSGWATVGSVRTCLADFATVSLAGKISKPGFGSVDQKVFERSTENLYQYDVASNVSLHKFFPESWKLLIPFYIDWSEVFITPQYDPTNPDLTLSRSLSNLSTEHERDSLLRIAREYTQNFSYNFTNVKLARTPKKQHPFNISNFSGTFAYNRYLSHDVDYQRDYKHQYKVAFNYGYNMRPKNYQPFKSSKINLIKDFNFYLIPSSVSFKSEWDRLYKEQQRRNLSAYTFELPTTASKSFYWYRTYNVNYPLSKGLKLSYNATNNSRINEPDGVIDKTDEDVWRDYKREVWNSAKTLGENMEFMQKWNLTWQVPVNKISILNWTTANYKFSGSYNWQRGTETTDDTIDYGNSITNTGTHTIDGTLNFTKLYSKSKYLAGVQKRMKQTSSSKNKNTKKKETVKYTKSNFRTNEDSESVINHKLGTTDIKVTIIDEDGQLVPSETQVISPKKVKVICKRDVEKGKVTVVGKKDVEQTALTRATDQVVNTLMMFKTANISYTQAEGSFVPGYKYGSQWLGMNKPFSSLTPTFPYVFGFVPDNIDDYLTTDQWLVDNESGNISDKMKYTYSNRLKIQASLEPIKNMRITLSSERSYSHNYSKYLWGDPTENELNKLTSGNFSVSCNTLSSAFNSDKAYELFKENRKAIAHRLALQNIGPLYETDVESGFPTLYDEMSQDVLIPAFYAAYTGRSIDKVDINTYFVPVLKSFKNFLQSLNWKLTYNGLSKVAFFKEYFKSININHAYTSNYNLGSYSTFTSANMYDEEFYIDPIDGSLYLSPDYDVSTISISERLNPLIGFDSRLKNNMTAKVELRRNRTVTLSFTNTEISEVSNFEYVIGAGYVIEDVKINISTGNSKKHFENDITLRLDFSIRDNQTIRRNIAEDITRKISGTKSYALKTYAEYMLSDRITLRFYLEYTMNQPLTNGYRTSTTSGGLNIRLSLM